MFLKTNCLITYGKSDDVYFFVVVVHKFLISRDETHNFRERKRFFPFCRVLFVMCHKPHVFMSCSELFLEIPNVATSFIVGYSLWEVMFVVY